MALPRRSRPVLVRLAGGAVALGVLAGCGAPAADPAASGPGVPAPTASASPTAAPLLPPDRFAEVVEGGDAVVLNVHVPDEGSLPGTDLAIPYDDDAALAAALPADHSAPVALYCRSGSMSADAAQTLERLGYTDVVDLDGGMIAWSAAGYPLLPPAA